MRYRKKGMKVICLNDSKRELDRCSDERATRQFQGVLKNVSLLLFCALEEWVMVSLAKEQSKLL